MTGIYLKCEDCPTTIGGEEVTANGESAPNRSGSVLLRKRAAERGWTSAIATVPGRRIEQTFDWCPICSIRRRAENASAP